MAYYDYQCRDCGNRFEIAESFSEHDQHHEVHCPKCTGTNVDRVFEPVHAQTAKKS